MPSHHHKQGGEGLHNDFGGGMRTQFDRTYQVGEVPDYFQAWTSEAGGNLPHENMMPFLSLYAIIRIK